MKAVSLSALRNGRDYPQGYIPGNHLLMSESIPGTECGWKFTLKKNSNQPATFRLVALCLNQLRHSVPLYVGSMFIIITRKYYMTPHDATLTTSECETLCS
jgi:hypothetical protein